MLNSIRYFLSSYPERSRLFHYCWLVTEPLSIFSQADLLLVRNLSNWGYVSWTWCSTKTAYILPRFDYQDLLKFLHLCLDHLILQFILSFKISVPLPAFCQSLILRDVTSTNFHFVLTAGLLPPLILEWPQFGWDLQPYSSWKGCPFSFWSCSSI